MQYAYCLEAENFPLCISRAEGHACLCGHAHALNVHSQLIGLTKSGVEISSAANKQLLFWFPPIVA